MFTSTPISMKALVSSLVRDPRLAFRVLRFGAALIGAFVATSTPAAQSATAPVTTRGGVIEGRIFNPSTGEYLENVRVSIEGTALETFTDATGTYRLGNVPAGAARVKAFRTGIVTETVVVDVAAGQSTRRDFDLSPLRPIPGEGEAIKLSEFVVSTSKQMDGSAIAINTQRFAPNVINVVAADEFGPVTDGNVGEVLKSVPGITVGLGGGGEPFTISMNGVPANNVPVTVGGFNLATASAGTARSVGLEQISINNLSRAEVIYTPTPEVSGSALAGMVNMVPRSAFERSRPAYHVTASILMRDNARDFNKTPGPRRHPERKVHPSLDFSAVVPVNERFGFTLSASASAVYTPDEFSQMTWHGLTSATNGTAFPHTTPDTPYLSSYAVRDWTKRTKHNSLGATIDYKFSQYDRVSLSFQYGYSDFDSNQHTLSFFTGAVQPGGFSTTFTRGVAGAGEIRTNNFAQKIGGYFYMPNLTYKHDGPVWKWDLGLGLSRAVRVLKDVERGFFLNGQARRQRVTVSFADIFYLRPGTITVTDNATGVPVDPYSLGSYTLNSATSNALDASDVQQNAFGSIRRDFYGRVPFTLKTGFDLRRATKDIRRDNPTFTFAGADKNAAQLLDESFSTRTGPYGFPQIQWFSNEEWYELYRASPALFTINEATHHASNVQLSKYSDEVITSAYARGDTQFMQGRLRLTGGLRAEQTNVKGEGQLIDPTRNYQRRPDGSVVLVNGLPAPLTTDPVQAVRLTNVDRGLKAEKEYLRLFPSLNTSYGIRENLIARAGYYWSVGRPDFSQYAGSLTLPDTERAPSATNTIRVNNVGIKAWSARTMKVSFEYYFQDVGLISIGAFRRDFKNFFGSTRFAATPAFLDLYGLSDSEYGGFDVVTQYNIPTPVRMTGIDMNYKQALTFLPPWARGVQVFANASAQRALGDDSANFAGYIPRTLNFGASFSRAKYGLRVKWHYESRKRLAPVAAGASIEPGTFSWGAARALLDVSGEYFISKRWALFANLNNLKDSPVDLEISGPSTPEVAQLRQRERFGSLWTFSVKGNF